MARVVSRALLDEVNACPQWLAEAYGMYVGNDLSRFGKPFDLNVSHFPDLSEAYSRTEQLDDLKEVYAKLASTINFLVTRYGASKVDEIFVKFKSAPSLETVFETSFGEKITDIEREWRKALSSPIGE